MSTNAKAVAPGGGAPRPEAQADALERAILDRAKHLAAEHLRQGERSRERIAEESSGKLRLREEREILAAQAEADREYQRLVQAAEIRLQADMDRLRWALIQSVMGDLTARLNSLREDREAYRKLLVTLLAEAASSVERDDLVAHMSETDFRALQGQWEDIAREGAPGKTVSLASEPCPCSGGVLVTDSEGRIRFDNTFEGRIERFETALHMRILQRLFPTPVQVGVQFHG